METFSVDTVAVEHRSVEKNPLFVFAVETFSVETVILEPMRLE